jgi:hypothetical protein
MLEYVLGALLILILLYHFSSSSENAASWILNPPRPPPPPITQPIAIADIPKKPELPLIPTFMAYPTYATSYNNRLLDTVKGHHSMHLLNLFRSQI